MSSAPQSQQPHLVNKVQPPPVNGTSSTNTVSSSTAQHENSPADTVSSDTPQHPAPSVSGPTSKKGKVKKTTDPLETSKLLAAKISQLESDKAGERDIEAEIANEVRRANREISNLLAHVESPLSRLEALQKRYSDLLTDMRRLDRDHVRAKKRVEQLQKERDQSKTDLNKTNGVKDKLEKLCRELQKDNKKMKEEYKELEETETKKRLELNEKFDEVLSEVQGIVKGKESSVTNDVDAKGLQVDLDQMFNKKFKSFLEQYELREIQFNADMRMKEAEVLVNMAKYEQEKKRADQAEERARGLSAQVATFSQTETELRSQLNIYVEKFKQVEDTLNNSNDLFLTFRKEMEDMSKKTKRLEKENMSLTRKHDMTNRNIIEMAEERTKMHKDMEMLRKRNDQLEKLCRGMQAQGRGSSAKPSVTSTTDVEGEHDEDGGTESEYDYDEEEEEEDEEDDDEDGSEEGDDGVTDDNKKNGKEDPPKFGPVPPPPAASSSQTAKKNGVAKGEVNGTHKH